MSLCENTRAICILRGLAPAGGRLGHALWLPPAWCSPWPLPLQCLLLPMTFPLPFCPPCCPVPFSCFHLICLAPSFLSLRLQSVTWEKPLEGLGEREERRL